MSIEQLREPAGTPTGGRFAATSRPEAALTLDPRLSEAEANADTALTASWVEGEKVADRIAKAREHLGCVRARHLTAEAFGRHADAAQWAERVVAAEEDLGDLQALHGSTVPGMAALQARYDFHRRAADEGRADPHDADGATRHTREAEVAARQLEDASDVMLEPVRGGHDLPSALHREWEPVAMVASPVQHPWQPTPSAYVVSFVDTATGRPRELARLTLPATLCEDDGRVDKAAVIDAVTHAAQAPDPARAEPARALVAWVGATNRNAA